MEKTDKKVRDETETLKTIKDLEVEMEKLTEVILSDKELIKKCREWIDKIFEIKDASQFLTIPSDYDNDPDVLFFELIHRYQNLGELVEEAEDMLFNGKRFPENNNSVLAKFLGKGEGPGAIKINVGVGVDGESENGKKMKAFLEKEKKQ